jgi:hypothetical protein
MGAVLRIAMSTFALDIGKCVRNCKQHLVSNYFVNIHNDKYKLDIYTSLGDFKIISNGHFIILILWPLSGLGKHTFTSFHPSANPSGLNSNVNSLFIYIRFAACENTHVN